MLVWEMNGKPLPKIHGGPLRMVVAGYIGARSTKWVYKINALPVPSYGPVQRSEYLYYNQQVNRHGSLGSNELSLMLRKPDRQAQHARQQWILHWPDACLVGRLHAYTPLLDSLSIVGAPL